MWIWDCNDDRMKIYQGLLNIPMSVKAKGGMQAHTKP